MDLTLNFSTRIQAAIAQVLAADSKDTIPRAALPVLETMARTITSDNPGRQTKGTYSDSSCYGKVAHRLRNQANPNWYILLFSFGHPSFKVAHACMYSDSGERVVDTFSGMPTLYQGKLYYERPGYDVETYPLLYCITVGKFLRLFVES